MLRLSGSSSSSFGAGCSSIILIDGLHLTACQANSSNVHSSSLVLGSLSSSLGAPGSHVRQLCPVLRLRCWLVIVRIFLMLRGLVHSFLFLVMMMVLVRALEMRMWF